MPLSPPTLHHLNTTLDRAERRPVLTLFVLCLVIWLPGFFTLPPGDRDESRFAQATKQMMETGNYVQIRNGAVARNQKPVGIYWLQLPFALAARGLGAARGNPIWPYRLPSLIGGLTAVIATYGFGRRLVGSRSALLGAVFLAASAILTVETHIAKTDAVLLAATTLAMGVLSRAWLDPAGLRARTAMLFWGALGVGVLVKGPVAPMVVGLAALWLTVTGWRAGRPSWLLALRPLLGILLLFGIVLPWFVAIGLATHGRFFSESVGGDLAGKLAGSSDAHGAPFGLHLVLLPVLLFGGGVAAMAGSPMLWTERKQPAMRLLTAWIVPSWLVFEFVATKLPHYTLPLYPPLALLGARWVLQSTDRRGHVVTAAIAGFVVALLGLVALALPEVVAPGWHPLDLLGLPVCAIALLMLEALRRVWPDARRAVLIMLCGAPFLYAGLLGFELPRLRPLWMAPRLEAALAAHWPSGRMAGAAFGLVGFAEPSVMFLCGTDTALFATADAAAGFLAGGGDRVVAVSDPYAGAFVQQATGRGLKPVTLGTVEGYNYSRGRRIRLTLYATLPTPSASAGAATATRPAARVSTAPGTGSP